MVFSRLLSKRDAITLLELIHASTCCSSEEDFKELVDKLSEVISYDFATCVCGKKDVNSNLESYNVININYPSEWIELYAVRGYHQIDPVIKENFANFKLQRWADTYKQNRPPKDFLSIAEDFMLEDGFTYGQKNPVGNVGSLFSISGRTIEYNTRTEMILELIVPHLHQAIMRIVDRDSANNIRTLSKREIEVLNWLRKGKSSWDISMILHIAEVTVNYHIENIKRKLDVVNRLQAVAVAVQQGLIDIG